MYKVIYTRSMSLNIDQSYQSPNYNDRRDGAQPSYLILHYTGMPTAKDAIDRLCDSTAEVSAHYVVDEDGAILQLVDEEKRAWHAGVSSWRGITDMNSHSIGIEIVNEGHEAGYRPFPDVQIAAVKALCRDIMARRGIAKTHVLGHSDIAPGRKLDPGPTFPWQDLARDKIGIWPDANRAAAVRGYHDLLTIGYGADCDEATLWDAFHRHYYADRVGDAPNGESLRRAAVVALLMK